MVPAESVKFYRNSDLKQFLSVKLFFTYSKINPPKFTYVRLFFTYSEITAQNKKYVCNRFGRNGKMFYFVLFLFFFFLLNLLLEPRQRNTSLLFLLLLFFVFFLGGGLVRFEEKIWQKIRFFSRNKKTREEIHIYTIHIYICCCVQFRGVFCQWVQECAVFSCTWNEWKWQKPFLPPVKGKQFSAPTVPEPSMRSKTGRLCRAT